MSDLMLLGVLRAPLPDDPADMGIVEWTFLRSAARSAAARIEALEREIADANADAERLAVCASAERHFGQLIEDEIDIEPEETTFAVRVMPEGRAVAVRTWADVAAETEAALAAHRARKEGKA